MFILNPHFPDINCSSNRSIQIFENMLQLYFCMLWMCFDEEDIADVWTMKCTFLRQTLPRVAGTWHSYLVDRLVTVLRGILVFFSHLIQVWIQWSSIRDTGSIFLPYFEVKFVNQMKTVGLEGSRINLDTELRKKWLKITDIFLIIVSEMVCQLWYQVSLLQSCLWVFFQ